MLAVVLSGELDGELGKEEFRALASSYKCGFEKVSERVVVSDDCGENFIRRLAYAKVGTRVVWRGSIRDISQIRRLDRFREVYDGFKPVVWKFNSKVDSQEIKETFANSIHGHPNLDNPRIVFDLIVINDETLIGRRIWKNDPKDYAIRHPQRRPVFHPTSLKPKLARFLINLSGVKPGQTLLDPFCGVGGILIEAGLMGIKPTGVELNQRWASGAKRNIEYYGVDGNVVNANFFEWRGGRYDAIVTDMPYGRSSMMESGINEFYPRAIKKFREHTSNLVIVGPIEMDDMLENAKWKIKTKLHIRVHKSLDRWIYSCSLE